MPGRQVTRRCGTYDRAQSLCPEAAGTLHVLGADEMEALRLSDLLGLDQTEAARRMDISQSTFHRILAGAHHKVAASLVRGHPLTVARAWDADLNGARAQEHQENCTGGISMTTRIALPTDDGTVLCQHFGRAHYYKVVEITDGKVTSSELRDKFAHVHGEENHGESDVSHEEVHGRMADAAHGCDTIIAGGMGMGAINALTAAGYSVMQTDKSNLDEIVEAYLQGVSSTSLERCPAITKEKDMAPAENEQNMTSQVNHVRHVLAVASGKGGVGKSLVSAMAAVELARRGLKAGIMDADITGPSIPRLFGLTARPESSMVGIIPPETATGVKIISMNLFLDDAGQPVIWRGPLLTSAIKQFWTDVAWGDLDILIVDLPPGTADVPLTAFQSLPVDGILMVTTPQELASMIVEKAAGLAKQMHKPILGIVENMVMVTCSHCGEAFELFGPSHAEELADHIGAPVLARLPIDPTVAALADTGHVEDVKMAAFAPVTEALAKYIATPSTVFAAPNPAPTPKASYTPCSCDTKG